MNKRLIKKKIKKGESFNGVIHVVGNNGGDVLEIYDNCNGTVNIWSGHCCVTTIDCIVPVEFITSILSQVMIDNHHDISAIIDSFKWGEDFKEELKNKVRKS